MSSAGNSTEPKRMVYVYTTSDHPDDGYQWRKYGQKTAKGKHPRIYYRCAAAPSCPVRKHLERASDDKDTVVIMYMGEHNHDQPVSHGAVGGIFAAPMPDGLLVHDTAASKAERHHGRVEARMEPGNSSASLGSGMSRAGNSSGDQLDKEEPDSIETQPRKGFWTPEEDKLLFDYILANGPGNWHMVPKLAG
ncbi:unnamed protein product [Urochloa humidicola]